MFVGVCRIQLRIDEIDSLKEKRSIVRKVVERTASRFNVAVAEVDAQDVHRRAVVGVAVVSNEAAHANAMIDDIVSFIAGMRVAHVEDRQMEILPFRHGVGSEDELDRLGWSDFEGPDGA